MDSAPSFGDELQGRAACGIGRGTRRPRDAITYAPGGHVMWGNDLIIAWFVRLVIAVMISAFAVRAWPLWLSDLKSL